MTENVTAEAGSLETPKDAGTGGRGLVTRWLKELELAGRHEESWRAHAGDAYCRYRDEDKQSNVGYAAGTPALGARGSSNRFNILYSNVQTICPALYNAQPRPDVRRRYGGADDVGREVATILERALSYGMDVYDFDLRMRQAVKDMQIVGRGVTRVRYKPYLLTDDSGQAAEDIPEADGGEQAADDMPEADGALDPSPVPGPPASEPDGKPEQRLAYEAVVCEHVPWKAFRVGPGRTWDEVPWIAFGPHLLRKEQVRSAFGPRAAEDVELDYAPAGIEEGSANDPGDVVDTFKRTRVWEIWDKESRKVYWISPSLGERPLRVDDDPYNLEGFFPIPRPLYAVETSDTLIPIEPFRFYKEQARELDRLTGRIEQIIDACRAKGIYDSTIEEMERLAGEGDNILIPSETAANLMVRGGIQNGVWMWPVEKIAGALVYLYQQREAIKQTIYETTGIADIMRGSTIPTETLGSQRLKAHFGTMRIDDQKREVARFARDLLRLKAEIIAERFSPQTLMQMTAVELPSGEQKQLARAAARRAEQAGRPVPPEIRAAADRPSWEEVLEVMRADGPRAFRINVETTDTGAADTLEEQKNVTQFFQALGGFFQTIGPAVATGYLPRDAAVKLLMAGMRRFKFGREVEDAFEAIAAEDAAAQQPGQPPGRPGVPGQPGRRVSPACRVSRRDRTPCRSPCWPNSRGPAPSFR